MSERVLRVGELMKAAVGEVLIRGVKDPRVTAIVSVTDVWVSGDLREARVYVSLYGEERQKRDTLRGLKSSAGYVRREVARKLQLRYTPTLDFVLDDGIERGARVLDVMREAGLDVSGPKPSEPLDFGDEAEPTEADPDTNPGVAPDDETATEPSMPAVAIELPKHTTVKIDAEDEGADTQPVPAVKGGPKEGK